MHSMLDFFLLYFTICPMIYSKTIQTKLSTADLHQRIYKLYDHLYANSPVRTPKGIATEVGKILHTAMFMEQQQGQHSFEGFEPSPAFQFNVTQLNGLTNGFNSTSESIANHIRQYFQEMNNSWKLYDSDIINLNNSDISYICAQLNYVLISDNNRDVFGDALEIFRGKWSKREGGQFFTDQQVTLLAMKFIQFDPRNGDDLVDICAGTGGFCLLALSIFVIF